MQYTRKLALGSLLVFVGGLAHAADQTILGSSFQVKNPGAIEKRKVGAKAKEKPSSNTIVGNPTVAGGTLVITANGTTPSTQAFALPQGVSPSTGKNFWSGDAVKGFKYKDPKGDNGPVKGASIKKTGSLTFLIKVSLTGKNGTILIVPPNPGTSACVLLGLNGGDTYSIQYASPAKKITNKATLFKVTKPVNEGSCVGVTTTTTSTTTTSSSTSTTLYGSPSRAFVERVLSILD